MKTTILITAAIALLSATNLLADDAYIVNTITERVLPALALERYDVQDTARTPLLGEGETHSFVISPRYGERVKLVAVGDWDSNDVDMFVVGRESGNLVRADILDDDIPVCEFTSEGGSYRVVIKVVDTDRPAWVRMVYATK